MKKKLNKLIQALNKDLINEEEAISLGLLAMLSGENILLIDPPRTTKSEIARRLSQVIKDINYYEYLLTKFTTPEERLSPNSLFSSAKGWKGKSDELCYNGFLKKR